MTSSDHIPIVATISTTPITIPIKPRLQYHKADWPKFKSLLAPFNPSINPNSTPQEIDHQLQQWTKQIQAATKESIPTIASRAIPGVKPDSTIKFLQALHSILQDSISQYGPTLGKYRLLSRLQRHIRDHYKDIQNKTWKTIIGRLDLEKDPAKFWTATKKFQGSNKQTTKTITDENGLKLYETDEIERAFRRHWQGIFTDDGTRDNNFTRQIDNEMTARQDEINPLPTADLSRLNPGFPKITRQEFNSTLRSFKNRSPGPTGITIAQLKQLPENMTNILLTIFNLSLSLGYFPNQLKSATMILIPKSPLNLHDMKNYRPISLLDTHGKILDKILNRRLTDKLTDLDKFNPRQHGFRQNRGTHTAIATLNEKISQDLRTGHKIDLVLRDVTKAFDKVWHNGLKHKLTSLDLPDCMTRTICNFMDNRTAALRINHLTGPTFPLQTGVPQGSCLSPNLYNFYVHDLPQPIPQTDYICFADDITQVISSHRSPRFQARLIQRAIEQINQFEKQWKIQTHLGKFKLIAITFRKTEPVTINNSIIPYTNRAKVLGLDFNPRGFSPHIAIRTITAKHRLSKLNRFRHLNESNKRLLYIATVRSSLIYPTIPLHTLANSQIKKLQRVQNKATRFITGNTLSNRIDSITLHNSTLLDPINVHLHKLAKNLWQQMEEKNPEIASQLEIQPDHIYYRKKHFPSSRRLASLPEPAPIYT